MRVTVLGCGGSAGVPMLGGVDGRGQWGACDPGEPRNRRTRTSIVIEAEGRRVLVDTSPDLRAQLIACAIPRIDAVVFTHAHADHIAGLDDVRILNRIVDRPIAVYAMPETLESLERRFDYAFRPWAPPGFFRPVLESHAVEPGAVVAVEGIEIAVFCQDHGHSRTLGMRCGGFGYSTDVVTLDDAAFAALAGVDTWLVGCFQRGRHTTHASLETVLGWAARVGARRTVLTHMGPDLDWAWLAANLPENVEAAHDGLVLEI